MDKCKKCGECCYLHIVGRDKVIKTDIVCPNLDSNKLCKVYDDRPLWCLTAEQMKRLNLLPASCGYKE